MEFYDPNSAEAAERASTFLSGSFSVQFNLANPWFWRGVITKASTTGAGPYTHDFDGTPPWSMEVALGDEANTDELTLLGWAVDTCTVEIPENDVVSVTLNGPFADESHSDTLDTSQVTESYDPLMFADGTISTESTTRSLVQNISVEISNNVDIKGEAGSRVGVDYRFGPRVVTVDFEKIREDNSIRDQFYGGSSPSAPQSRVDGDDAFSLTITLDNGKTGADQNKQTIKGTGSFPNSITRSGDGDPSADVLTGQTLGVNDLDVEAVNNDSSAS